MCYLIALARLAWQILHTRPQQEAHMPNRADVLPNPDAHKRALKVLLDMARTDHETARSPKAATQARVDADALLDEYLHHYGRPQETP